ncbi:hypothetical protein Bbelb_148000 [Branchiostoma belcheri]|nr:hypothetical protein Bbelb_148000 [Branchiostoma belcheri]
MRGQEASVCGTDQDFTPPTGSVTQTVRQKYVCARLNFDWNSLHRQARYRSGVVHLRLAGSEITGQFLVPVPFKWCKTRGRLWCKGYRKLGHTSRQDTFLSHMKGQTEGFRTVCLHFTTDLKPVTLAVRGGGLVADHSKCQGSEDVYANQPGRGVKSKANSDDRFPQLGTRCFEPRHWLECECFAEVAECESEPSIRTLSLLKCLKKFSQPCPLEGGLRALHIGSAAQEDFVTPLDPTSPSRALGPAPTLTIATWSARQRH